MNERTTTEDATLLRLALREETPSDAMIDGSGDDRDADAVGGGNDAELDQPTDMSSEDMGDSTESDQH